MQDLYIDVEELSDSGLFPLVHGRILNGTVYRQSGFEFKILYADRECYQIKVYAYNTYTTILLDATIENCGIRIGGQYDIPIMVKTDEGFAGVLCDYMFVISKNAIDLRSVLGAMGIGVKANMTADEYYSLKAKFDHLGRITGFTEMMNYIQRDAEYRKSAEFMAKHTKVYNEYFASSRNPAKNTYVSFQENNTLSAARKAVMRGKHTAVLNFANPVEPGGGVFRGAKAQEESICRSSDLYKSLTSENAEIYYQSNNTILSRNQFNSMFLGTDKVIYSPGVQVLKQDIKDLMRHPYAGEEQYIDSPYRIDVITCAAPFFSGSGFILPNGDLQYLFEKRIRNILEAAIDNEVETIILGAFGCGAFHNPANVVADAFREVLLEKRYITAFDEIVFAVKRTATVCPNVEAFKRNFSLFPNISYNYQ